MISFGMLPLLPFLCSVPVWTARLDMTATPPALEPGWDEGLGCYCKKVRSVADCSDRDGSEEEPRRLRWFHGASNGEESLCCKLAGTSMLSFPVGFGYDRQPSSALCIQETRPVPREACCRVGYSGFYVSNVTMHLQAHANSLTTRTFRKSPPEFEVADIYAAKDYNGSFVNNLSDVHAFVGGLLNARARRSMPNPHAFSKSWDEMVQDTVMPCMLRKMPTKACCCDEASLKEEEGCLPTGITGLSTEPVVVRGNYSRVRLYGFSYVPWAWRMMYYSDGPEPKKYTLKYATDSPGGEEYEILPGELTSRNLTWERGNQWSRTCEKHEEVPTFVKDYPKSTECSVFKFTRRCPDGEGYYVKKRETYGKCFREPGSRSSSPSVVIRYDELTHLGGFAFTCPAGLRSGQRYTYVDSRGHTVDKSTRFCRCHEICDRS
ncbi:unnamed protein product [Symbiodinium sp. CCMP2592]|nr:unnamed protein product [Symbiodinium sp. CCMP2592]